MEVTKEILSFTLYFTLNYVTCFSIAFAARHIVHEILHKNESTFENQPVVSELVTVTAKLVNGVNNRIKTKWNNPEQTNKDQSCILEIKLKDLTKLESKHGNTDKKHVVEADENNIQLNIKKERDEDRKRNTITIEKLYESKNLKKYEETYFQSISVDQVHGEIKEKLDPEENSNSQKENVRKPTENMIPNSKIDANQIKKKTVEQVPIEPFHPIKIEDRIQCDETLKDNVLLLKKVHKDEEENASVVEYHSLQNYSTKSSEIVHGELFPTEKKCLLPTSLRSKMNIDNIKSHSLSNYENSEMCEDLDITGESLRITVPPCVAAESTTGRKTSTSLKTLNEKNWRDQYGLLLEGISDFYDFHASTNPSRSRQKSCRTSSAI